MNGWTVAFILYLIPVLVGMIPGNQNLDRNPTIIVVIFWPPLMLLGGIILWFQSRKR